MKVSLVIEDEASLADERFRLETILNGLSPVKGEMGRYLVTRTHEEYQRLVRAATSGQTAGRITVGKAGLRLNGDFIIPPDSILMKTELGA